MRPEDLEAIARRIAERREYVRLRPNAAVAADTEMMQMMFNVIDGLRYANAQLREVVDTMRGRAL